MQDQLLEFVKNLNCEERIETFSKNQVSYIALCYNIAILLLVRTPGTVLSEFVLTGLLSTKKALKGTKEVFVLTRVYCKYCVVIYFISSWCK